jgi:hypothetical protein
MEAGPEAFFHRFSDFRLRSIAMRLVVILGISGQFLIDLCHTFDGQQKLLARKYAASGRDRRYGKPQGK